MSIEVVGILLESVAEMVNLLLVLSQPNVTPSGNVGASPLIVTLSIFVPLLSQFTTALPPTLLELSVDVKVIVVVVPSMSKVSVLLIGVSADALSNTHHTQPTKRLE